MAYQRIPFGRFALGVGIVAVPAALLQGDRRWAYGYVLLILVMFVVYHSTGLQQFSAWIQTETGGRK